MGFFPSHPPPPVSLLHRPFLPFSSPPTSSLLRAGSSINHGPLLLFCQQKHYHTINCCCCLVSQFCLTLSDPMDCSPPGSSTHGDSPGKNTGVGCHVLLQAIFPTQESNPGLSHCRQILLCLSHKGSPYLCIYRVNHILKLTFSSHSKCCHL